mmetsp:Transcript_5953/g.10696  ORF Transcript_5953/g.10696 Transcript_5953/m.10696 type:complete len:620 (+) Transcript_5953:104-1963(+)
MGATCRPCCEKPEEAQKEALRLDQKPAFPGQSKDRPSTSKKGSKDQQQQQTRASLQVKDGGFALANFAGSNDGKVEDFYSLEKEKLGEGGFGSVRKARDKRLDKKVAVKSIRKKGVENIQKLLEEMEIMRLLDHPNIVRFHETFQDRRSLHLVLELCEGGELFEAVTAAGSINEQQAAGCIRDMLLAINYLHQNRIMHRDLKPENFLLSQKGEIGKTSLKLIDFGLAKRFEPGTPARTKAGTPNYIAPEVLAGKYDEKVDIWSIGVITFLLLSGKHPFTGKNLEQVLQRVKNAHFTTDGKNWANVSQAGKSVVQAFLQKTPMVRPTASAGLKHKWFEQMVEKGDIGGLASNLELSGLVAFGRMNRLKKACLTVIASQLSEESIDALRALFMGMDANCDGTLTLLEIREGLTKAGVDMPDNLEQLLKEADTDGSGVVDYTEFLAATMDKKIYNQEEVVWTAFKKFDLDDNGSIDVQELSKVLGDDSVIEAMHIKDRDKLETIFHSVDKNGDGVIDFDEFFQMMRQAEGAGKDKLGDGMENGRRKPSKSPSKGSKSPRSSSQSKEASRMSRGNKDLAKMLKQKQKERLKGIVEDEGEEQEDENGEKDRSFTSNRRPSLILF